MPPKSDLAHGPFDARLIDETVKLQVQYMRMTVGTKRPSHRLLFAELAHLQLLFHFAKLCILQQDCGAEGLA